MEDLKQASAEKGGAAAEMIQARTDEPKWSSAALCTNMHLLNHRFRPEYTHQCLPGERYEGYRPFAHTLQQALLDLSSLANNDRASTADDDNRLLHPSHAHPQDQTRTIHELEVTIQLAPSGRSCHVSMKTNDSSSSRTTSVEEQPATKKPKISHDLESIQRLISTGLPAMVENHVAVSEGYLSNPIGDILCEYSVPSSTTGATSHDNDLHFVLTLARPNGSTTDTVTNYHNQVQRMALWFIENADGVDIGNNQNQSSGFWSVLYLFQKHTKSDDSNNPHKYSIVGYTTLFHFEAPFHKPTPGVIVRICQALILPPYQRQGHGKRMYQIVLDLIHSRCVLPNGERNYLDGRTVVQLNVEDPAPGFVALRDLIEWQLIASHPEWWPTSWKTKLSSTPGDGDAATDADHTSSKEEPVVVDPASYFVALSNAEASNLSHLAKVTCRQTQLIHELQRLERLESTLPDLLSQDQEEYTKQFRLMVKRRLNKENMEELSTFSKDEKKTHLATLYDREMKLYQRLVEAKKRCVA